MEIDKLDRIFRLQKEFASKFIDLKNASEKRREEHSKDLILAILSESAEVLAEMNWKHWSIKRKKVNSQKILEELADILHFLVELALVWGSDAKEFHDIYVDKNQINFLRQLEGY